MNNKKTLKQEDVTNNEKLFNKSNKRIIKNSQTKVTRGCQNSQIRTTQTRGFQNS